MEDARALIRTGAVHGALIVAGFQTRGRGRTPERRWVSAPGRNLLFNLLLAADALATNALAADARGGDARAGVSGGAAPTVARLPLLCGLAVAHAVEAVSGVACQVKWPNDVIMGGCKVAGCLCAATAGWYSIGVGVTCNQLRAPRAAAWRARRPAHRRGARLGGRFGGGRGAGAAAGVVGTVAMRPAGAAPAAPGAAAGGAGAPAARAGLGGRGGPAPVRARPLGPDQRCRPSRPRLGPNRAGSRGRRPGGARRCRRPAHPHRRHRRSRRTSRTSRTRPNPLNWPDQAPAPSPAASKMVDLPAARYYLTGDSYITNLTLIVRS